MLYGFNYFFLSGYFCFFLDYCFWSICADFPWSDISSIFGFPWWVWGSSFFPFQLSPLMGILSFILCLWISGDFYSVIHPYTNVFTKLILIVTYQEYYGEHDTSLCKVLNWEIISKREITIKHTKRYKNGQNRVLMNSGVVELQV